MKNLKISIITVVKNNKDTIEKNILSLINQNYKNYEHIIIDGGSEDGTIEVIKKYQKNIKCFISEKDNGIYDAMNKGIKVANGDVIVFCNSGDFFYKNSLQKVMLLFDKFNYDFIFGTVLRNYKKGKILKFGFNFNRMLYNFDFATSHSTGFFLKKKIYNLIGNYNTKFKISADYDLYFRLYKKNLRGGYTKKNQKIGNMKSGGFSSKISFFQHLIEETKIRIHNSQNILFVLLIFVNAIFKNFNKLFLQNKS